MFRKGSGSAGSKAEPKAFRSTISGTKSTVLSPDPVNKQSKPPVVESSPNSTQQAPAALPTKTNSTQPASDRGSKMAEEVGHAQAADFRPSISARKESSTKKDLMISYSHADSEVMLKIRDILEKYGISVWVDVSGLSAGVDFLSKIGEAIIDCKLFLSLLSENSVKSKYCQDELALAYVSNRAIFPVALQSRTELLPLMDTGMKLQLASYDWVELGQDSTQFEEKFMAVVKLLKEELQRQEAGAGAEVGSKADNDKGAEKGEEPSVKTQKSKPPLMRKKTRSKLHRSESRQGDDSGVLADQWWKDNFGNKDDASYEEFWKFFLRDYKSQLDRLLTTQEDQDWLKGVLHREMEVDGDKLFRYELMAFSSIEGEYIPLWERVNIQASESWAMKEVFDMNSSVRVDAIENLGKFRTAAVIDALRDLLSDEDANARAVAAVSLARTDADDPVTLKFLMRTLNDKDRLVREAGCLALGHLRAKQAASKLLHMWRNDVISHVRDAANVALSQIGGPEVEEAMRVTKVLADEIRQLTAA